MRRIRFKTRGYLIATALAGLALGVGDLTRRHLNPPPPPPPPPAPPRPPRPTWPWWPGPTSAFTTTYINMEDAIKGVKKPRTKTIHDDPSKPYREYSLDDVEVAVPSQQHPGATRKVREQQP